ncbi:aromatic compound dioxygenase [Fomitiporia mediterranea MF3/22]|uniref:aromatic compound dioxygenase n=1 Tax=Fomitiporia mediterranea (strain MF3/22) TaxID=694068 RepID=UPI000440825C|nr:aromatic compound dioxygenase [Fomitiporia mediterranea MF3/22]EJC98301.1 aromatic compound dioxygenase [Fomitiporia mediterranea MF3/22]
MLKFAALFVLATTFTSQVLAHGAPPSGAAMMHRRQHNIIVGRSLQKRCGATLTKRRAARMQKRAIGGLTEFKRDTNDSLCLLTPEVTQGPYHILGELVRQNITQGQTGVPFEIDVDFIDIDTCEAVPNVWVDGWSCNATGVYSGYEAASEAANTGGTGSGGAPSGSGAPSGAQPSSTATGAYAGADSPDSAIGATAPGDSDNFLRGVWQADESGQLTMYSIVPGWYSGRATHFHIKVYTEGNGSIADNGTFIAGSAMHTGQFFFADDFMEKVGNVTPYNTNTIERLANADDMWYAYQNAEGYTADMDMALVDENDITAGVIGSITVGLNLTYTSPEITDYWWPGNSAYSASLAASETAAASASAA